MIVSIVPPGAAWSGWSLDGTADDPQMDRSAPGALTSGILARSNWPSKFAGTIQNLIVFESSTPISHRERRKIGRRYAVRPDGSAKAGSRHLASQLG